MKKFFLLSFIPTHVDLGLLVLRVVLGGLMLANHGWGKLTGFNSMFHSFADPLGIGAEASYILATAAETLGAAFVALGLFTRFAALACTILMGVAFFMAHGAILSGPRSGELALVFMTGFLAILIAGPGRFSIDAKSGGA